MPSRDISHILADNLKDWIAGSELYGTPPAVARKAEIAVNTVKNMLRRNGYATLDNIQKVAKVFNRQPWELLHPDPDRARREHSMYAKIAADFDKMTEEAIARAKIGR